MARFMVASVVLTGSFFCDVPIAVLVPAIDNTPMQNNHAMAHVQRLFFIYTTLSLGSFELGNENTIIMN